MHDDDTYYRDNIFNLRTINKEREKLINAQKVAIFVCERIFLLNRRKQNIDLNLVQLKRNFSWEKCNLFE